MKEIYKTEYLEVNFDKELKIVYMNWNKSSFTSEEYKQVWERTLEFGEDASNDVKYFLSNIVNQSTVSPTDRKWFEEKAVPRAENLGVIKAGIVLGSNPFKRY